MATPRHIMIGKVNWWWYLAPTAPIGLVGYSALLVAAFAFFMWLFSLMLTTFAVITRKAKEPRQ